MASNQPVTCRGCVHYYITYDPKAPYGCRALAFKSSKLPSLIVFESSGLECQAFEHQRGPAGR